VIGMFAVKPCKSGKAFSVVVGHGIDLSAAQKLAGAFVVKAATPHIVVAVRDACCITIYPSGRVLVKGAADEAQACELAKLAIDAMAG